MFLVRMGFPGGDSGKETACQCRRQKRCSFNPWVGENPQEEKMATQRWKKQKQKQKKKKKQISNIFKKVLIQILIEIQMIINFYLGL